MDESVDPPMERRLVARYWKLVVAHTRSASSVSAGPSSATSSASSLATTQAMWRFVNNPRVTMSALAAPLHEAGRAGSSDQDYVLLVHDWSKVDYAGHRRKADMTALTHAQDVGYELSTSLLVRTSDGVPVAPMQMHLKTAGAMHSSGAQPPPLGGHHLDQVGPTMQDSRQWGVGARMVHVIDREADSVGHLRSWDADGHLFLVRGDDRLVVESNQRCKLSEVSTALASRGMFRATGEISYQGRKAWQHVAETRVSLDRPARRNLGGGRREDVPGPPLTLRFVVAEVRDGKGALLATWYLLSNAPSQVTAWRLAQWYYWRWRIESFFKLLKSAGQQMEQWLQESGGAIGRRLMVASMACVMVWRLERQRDASSQRMKDLLVRLSGRQMKRTRPHTASALLAGLMILLPLLELLDKPPEELAEIQQLARQTLPLMGLG